LSKSIEQVEEGNPNPITSLSTPKKRKPQQDDEPPTPELKKLVKKKRVEVDKEMPKKLQMYTPGDTSCKICKFNAGSSDKLVTHFAKFHKNEYIYECSRCGKGFLTSEGHKNHMVGHDEDKRLKCTKAGCTKTFGSKGALKKHLANQHTRKPKGYKKPQCHYCKKEFAEKGNLAEHIQGCEANPDRVPLYCEICKEKGPVFYLRKRVLEHKRKTHGWQ